jgi:prophage regulatory protein
MARMLREREVKHITGLSRVTRWRMERRGEFPGRVHLAPRCVGWPEAEVMEWMRARSAERVASTVPTKPAKQGGAE